jgi:uncharacterized protein (DUF1778 family)
MRPAVIQIRLSDTEKSSIQKAAEFFGESLSEFLRRAALMRLKQGKNEPKDPFLVALHELTKDQVPEPLPPDVKVALKRARRERRLGIEKSISIDEALDMIKEWKKKR